MKKINVKGRSIRITKVKDEDFICLTDMLQAKDGNFFIKDWLRNRNTLEFLGIWERLSNPNFNWGEFALIKNKSGLNNFKISVKEWIKRTNAIGIKATAGRYGGTYANKDLAFEFAMWISAEFKIYLIREFQRLKEYEQKKLGWDIKRNLAKINYKIHTTAIKENLIPKELSKQEINNIYANEADVLNMALFCKTSKQYKIENKNKKGNIRDFANVSQLVCLSNLENLNAHFISEGLKQSSRLEKLNKIAISQMKLLSEEHVFNLLKIKNPKLVNKNNLVS